MNVKSTIGPKRYKPLVERPGWERHDSYRLGKKVLERGTEVRVRTAKGKHAELFTFQYAEVNTETGAVTLAFVGGRKGRKLDRFFRPEQIKVV
ncbi:hypothetical protein Wildcat_147 [Mycobacterium phage Wildcat]|uniref:DUF7246 domain-containing protein n=2 Tax=Mycobacterium virus Wildcat TaxID=1993859 RepID=Q19XT7_9CAUD|nr:hypothetical protein Wildcat_147 [Mycobacterium phage Wildcat]ABE67727.1 hypothetical protein Wildcat_147 [Mycobacterium phage Wildcat]QGJ90007.1 hypothetical protein PBI_MARYV_133 [Mycobacterium phage MaryV]